MLVLLTIAILTSCQAENVDTWESVLRTTIQTGNYFDDINRDLFGYKVALWGGYDGSSYSIIVGAPRGSTLTPPPAEGLHGLPYGVAYTCPITPGVCSGLGSGAGSGIIRRVYDSDPNLGGDDQEQKNGQFLGGVVRTSRDGSSGLLICAPRFIIEDAGAFLPIGRCYYTYNRPSNPTYYNIEGCLRDGINPGDQSAFGYCGGGTSGDIFGNNDFVLDAVSGPSGVVIGIPGRGDFTGGIIEYTIRNAEGVFGDRPGVVESGLLGYETVFGRIVNKASNVRGSGIIVASSAPRNNSLRGTVAIYDNEQRTPPTIFQVLEGQQVGECYGYSLVTADLNGDTLDELVVGAPFFSRSNAPNVGRLYVYENRNLATETFTDDDSYVPLVLHRIIPGTVTSARFGYALANIGDIDNNGIDDIAASAPFGSDFGKVFIYYGVGGADMIRLVQQVTRADLNFLSSVPDIEWFGASLSDGLDVDSNGYPDFAVGAVKSQQVVVLRSRPVANVTVNYLFNGAGSSGNAIDLDGGINQIGISVCMSISGVGVSGPLNINYRVIIEREKFEQGLLTRAFFVDASSSEINGTVALMTTELTCVNDTVQLRNNVSDLYSSIPVDLTVDEITPAMPAENDGNIVISSLTAGPIVRIGNSDSTGLILLFNGCGGGPCVSDLIITYNSANLIYKVEDNEIQSVNSVVAGNVTSIGVPILMRNKNLHPAIEPVIVVDIPSEVNFIRAYRQNSEQLSLRCDTTDERRVSCLIANVLLSENNVTAIFEVQTRRIVGSEERFSLTFTASSTSMDALPDDNVVMANITVQAQATVSIQSLFRPDQVPIGGTNPPSMITDPRQLGPQVQGVFVVRNSGPSIVPRVSVEIQWPSVVDMSDQHLLYPFDLDLDLDVSCDQNSLNPLNFGQGSRRRRQADPIVCPGHESCVVISCTIDNLGAQETFSIVVNGYVDDRSFKGRQDEVVLQASASVDVIVGSSYIQPGTNHDERTTTADLTGVPVDLGSESSSVEAWVIIVPIVVGIIILVVVIIILYFLGFFKRKTVDKGDTAELKKDSPENNTPEHEATGTNEPVGTTL